MPPDEARQPTFLIDRSLGRTYVAKALARRGASIELLDDHFPQTAPDPDWLAAVAARGWIILSKDLFNAYERQLILDSGGKAFILGRGDLSGEEMAAIFSEALPKMMHIASVSVGPFIYGISRGGQFRRIA